MARCKFCGIQNLEWLEDLGKHKLYDPALGVFHNCSPSKARREQVRTGVGKACKHGIAKDWFCEECANEERGEV